MTAEWGLVSRGESAGAKSGERSWTNRERGDESRLSGTNPWYITNQFPRPDEFALQPSFHSLDPWSSREQCLRIRAEVMQVRPLRSYPPYIGLWANNRPTEAEGTPLDPETSGPAEIDYMAAWRSWWQAQPVRQEEPCTSGLIHTLKMQRTPILNHSCSPVGSPSTPAGTWNRPECESQLGEGAKHPRAILWRGWFRGT
jgi:hypothetical protein